MYERDGVTPKVPEVKILIEPRTRREGGDLFHYLVKGVEFEMTEKGSVKMARKILKIAKEL